MVQMYNNGQQIQQQTNSGTYFIWEMVNISLAVWYGSTISGNTRYINYFLDVNGGNDGNGVNIQLWGGNNSNAQRFAITRTGKWTYVLRTKTSNYNKAVTVQSASCSNGGNVFQWQYNASNNDEWILEPVNKNTTLGNYYALTNYNKYVTAYPKLTNFQNRTADCANFVSQCMLASGIHYTKDWKVYRKNGTYSSPANITQLDHSWELIAPYTSPWISANEFKNYWRPRTDNIVRTGQEILNNPQALWNNPGLGNGDVVSMANKNSFGHLSDAYHTMYITGYGWYNGQLTYTLSYHSGETQSGNLLEIASRNKDKYFIFYNII